MSVSDHRLHSRPLDIHTWSDHPEINIIVDKVWHSKEEKDKGEKKGTHKDEDAWDDPPELGGEPSMITPVEGEFTDGLKGKHDRMREKMRDDKERAREKDAKAAEQVNGLPPKVDPCFPGIRISDATPLAMQAPIGNPLPRPFAVVTMSGKMDSC